MSKMNRKSERTLYRVKQNDDILRKLQIGGPFFLFYDNGDTGGIFNSSYGNDFSRLGTSIGENTHLQQLDIILDGSGLNVTERGFYDGLKRNSSIHNLTIDFGNQVIVEGVGKEILETYQENNRHLTHLTVYSCNVTNENGVDRTIASTLRRCTNLRIIRLTQNNITDGQLLPMVDAIRGHDLIEWLDLSYNTIGNAGCETLATWIRDPNSNLRILHI